MWKQALPSFGDAPARQLPTYNARLSFLGASPCPITAFADSRSPSRRNARNGRPPRICVIDSGDPSIPNAFSRDGIGIGRRID